MAHVQAMLLSGAGFALVVALLAAWRERARKRRENMDAVGLIAWPTVQMLALMALVVCALLALTVQ